MSELISLADLMGWVGMAVFISANFMRQSNSIFCAQGIGNILYCVHLFMIGAIAGLAVCSLATLRSFVGIKSNSKLLKWVCFGSIVLFFLSAILIGSVSGYFSAIAASCLSLALIVKDNTLHVRGLNLMASIMWIVFGVLTGSMPTIAMYMAGAITCAVGALQYEPAFAFLRAKVRQPVVVRVDG